MNYRKLLAMPLLAVACICHGQNTYTRYVNPFIGTREMGHTFPGATVPFGFVQLSPDTDTIPYEKDGKYNPPVYRYCAGYQYDDKTIVGFSHTHFNGTGHSDLGDFLIMPTVGKLQMNPGTADRPENGYRSSFRHETEKAVPGYYSVILDEPGVEAELTAAPRSGFHRYTFPETDAAHIILDLVHGIYNYDGKTQTAYIHVINDSTVTGYRITRGWGRTRYIYFALQFSKPFKRYGLWDENKSVYRGFWRRFDQGSNFPEMAGRKVKAHFDFSTKQNEAIEIKIGLSSVSMHGALATMQAEIGSSTFDQARLNAETAWDNELSRIRIKGPEELKVNFYTALYHALMSPVIYQDVDGSYRGIDHEIYRADNNTNFTIFSLWDTYRALHPFLTWMYPRETSGMISSMLRHYRQSPEKMLPVWSHHGNENWCMTGYHSVAVIADAYVKGIRGFDAEKALDACITTANRPFYEGMNGYLRNGFISDEESGNSASTTLEYAYDDYAISQLAKAMGKESVSEEYLGRSTTYKNVFDATSGFMRARKKDGTWKSPFDPLSTHGQGFIEGNSWNYSFFVPHDVPGMINLMGGDKKFINRLDTLFTMHLDDKFFAETEDVTREGLIGNYVHGNEPSHHAPYLYNWTSKPWKTQEKVRQVISTMYRNAPDGLCGNDDCGQMSAWYIFSALGFYPVCPGTIDYAIGSPAVSEAIVTLPGDKMLIIKAINQSEKNIYVKSVTLNGKKLTRPFLTHFDISGGGELVFEMSPKHP